MTASRACLGSLIAITVLTVAGCSADTQPSGRATLASKQLRGSRRGLSSSPASLSPCCMVKASTTPNFNQRSSIGLRAGDVLCVPVAVSNALMHLDQAGYPRLVAEHGGLDAQRRLIRHLAAPDRMNVGARGSYHRVWLPALARYVEQRGYAIQIKGRGRRAVAPYYAAEPITDYWLAKSTASPDTGVILTLGFYRSGFGGKTYRHLASHTVTLVGYEHDPHAERRTYLIHDPEVTTPIRCTFRRLGQGRFVGWTHSERGNSAASYLRAEGIPLRCRADAVILEDAVVFQVGPQRTAALPAAHRR